MKRAVPTKEQLRRLVTPEFLSKMATFAQICTDEMHNFADENLYGDNGLQAALFYGMFPVFLFVIHEHAIEDEYSDDVDAIMHKKLTEMSNLVRLIQSQTLSVHPIGHA